ETQENKYDKNNKTTNSKKKKKNFFFPFAGEGKIDMNVNSIFVKKKRLCFIVKKKPQTKRNLSGGERK
ncbi:hypothetical protein, partial [Leptospira borgpetersenii]|uniref:hypothetical protein n=1 Tax=Leptospira borgpetersenii TaxID=174 RepID=UPI0027DDE8D5